MSDIQAVDALYRSVRNDAEKAALDKMIDDLDKEVRKADFSFLKKLTDKELSQRLDIVRAQIPAAYKMAVEENSVRAHRALLQLNAQDDAVVDERMRRFDAKIAKDLAKRAKKAQVGK